MATNLAGGICLGQHSVCLLRAAALDTDCSPMGGADQAIVTLGIITLTAAFEYEDGRVFEPKNGCGTIGWTYEEADKIKRINLTGELLYHDWEMKQLLFGGSTITGHATASAFPGKIIGYNVPNFDATPNNGVYLEVIVRNVGAGVGDCAGSGTAAFPYAAGYIFGKAKLTPGDRTFEDAEAPVAFQGKVSGNPNLFNGPWNDYPGTGYIANSPMVEVAYGRTEYDAIAATAGCGYKALPAAS
jgi:hypothetical protein